MCQRRSSRLEGPLTMGSVRHAGCPAGRNGGLGGRSSSTVQQLLVVPGQLLPPGERPADMEELLSPLAVIPPKVRSYAQAATSSPLDGADWVYVAKGGGPAAHGGQVQWPLQGTGAGQQSLEGPGGRESGDHQQGPPQATPGQDPVAARPPTLGRPRTASISSVASPASAKRPGGPV